VKTVVVVQICGSGDAWKVAGSSDPPERVQERVVTLEIQGDGASGYHLVMSPAGCFTADSWHESISGAKETAAEVFGVASDAWA
jgi:hypothetical protein